MGSGPTKLYRNDDMGSAYGCGEGEFLTASEKFVWLVGASIPSPPIHIVLLPPRFFSWSRI
ncbi:conserved hypothetical protein [Ricinus communis]|uniref:Uncharacterized protein n=1 Tax=Ricinus communis TaxID=3988 RepID=B9RDA2_RICCO|nr:conserved hypothetical protein [Ricinus communis]